MDRILRFISLLLSAVLHPLFVPTYAVAALCCVQVRLSGLTVYANAMLWLVVITLLFTCVIPLLYIIYLRYRNRISDYQLSNRRERDSVYVCSAVSMLFWLWSMYRIGIRGYLLWFFIAALLTLVVVMIVNRYWKISIHTATFGALVGAVAAYQQHNGLYNMWLLPVLFVVLLLLMYSRIYLKSHTPLQTVCGFLTGLLMVWLPVAIWF